MTNERRNLINQYNQAHRNMQFAWTEDEARAEYKTACECQQLLNPGKCGMKDCSRCFLTKECNDICREIRHRPATSVTINLWGCNVSIKTK